MSPMLRTAPRAFHQSTRYASLLSQSNRQSIRHTSSTALSTSFRAQVPVVSSRRPLALTIHALFPQQAVRYASDDSKKPRPVEALATKTHGNPEESTTRSVFTELERAPANQELPAKKSKKAVKSGIAGDLEAIKDTFALTAVPREAYVLGLAGLLPYLGTSITSVYCAWDIHYAHQHGSGILLSEESATWLLSYLEPLQVGYGAVIISFLGAIHWGLEWAKYGGTYGYRRYAVGVIAPAIAWPTVLLPYEYALITQFLGFTYLYYADAAATTRGWAPPWYSSYRFVLTSVVGAAIVISLVGKSEIHDVLERRAMGTGAVTDPKGKIVTGLSEGEKKLASYEKEKSKIWDKKEEKRKAKEEEEQKKKEEEEKKNKGKKKTKDNKKGGDEEEAQDEPEDEESKDESESEDGSGEEDESKDDDKQKKKKQ